MTSRGHSQFPEATDEEKRGQMSMQSGLWLF